VEDGYVSESCKYICGCTLLIVAPVEYLNSFETNRRNVQSFVVSTVFKVALMPVSSMYLHHFTFSMLINTITPLQKTAKNTDLLSNSGQTMCFFLLQKMKILARLAKKLCRDLAKPPVVVV
jgi:hypothetical protein